MNEALIAILVENIAFGLRHKYYERTIEVRDFTYSTTTGKGQESEVQRYRRFEDDDLKEQRVRLYNSPTPGVIAPLRNHFQNLATLEGIRETFEVTAGGEQALKRLQADYYNFLPGENINDYLNRTLEHLNATDPNAWVVFERYDTRNEEGRIIGEIGVWPWVVPSVDVLNFEYRHGHGNLQWVLFRTSTMERTIQNGSAYLKVLENYYLYTPGKVVRAREVGDKTIQENGETMTAIEVFPVDASQLPNMQGPPVYVGSPKVRNFYVSVIETGTNEVPAMVAGAYMDETTEQETRVSWFQPGECIIKDMVRLKNALDVTLTVHTYPRRTEYTKPCKYVSADAGECIGGWMNGIQDTEHRCPACGGSGKAPNFTTDQAVLQLILPDDPALVVELSKLAFTEPVDISFPEMLERMLSAKEQQFIRTVFMSDPHQKPDGAGDMTAFEVAKLHEGVEKKLKVFCRHYSRVWELAYRVGLQYREIPYISVDHSFPEDLQIDTLDELIQRFGLAKEKGVGYEVLAAIRKRIQQKTYEGSPAMQKRIEARYKWLPFDDKSETETAMVLASRSPLDDARVLRENHREIFLEIEEENPLFADMAYQRQKAIIAAKVAEFKGRIVLIDDTTTQDAMTFDTPASEDAQNDNQNEETQNDN